ncbi:MAG: hypothetical protein BMS9Abin23_0401 [Thermodesulfobacteriota bacterium]|nr:MAG: hypothetical protein BMS9Abin23_0401 [Thermodesulfobacteriota bacterium]
MTTEKKIWLLSIFFIALFAYGLYSAFRPSSYPLRFVRGDVRAISENVIIGPYPSEEEFRKLKYNLGIDIVVSLMDPDSAIEGGFVRKEKVLAEKYGMPFKNFPMDFLNLSGQENKRQAERAVAYILSVGDKKLYVHCYLGRHRIKIFEEEFKKTLPVGKKAEGDIGGFEKN